MLEWYEAYADYRDTMERIEQLVARTAQEVLGTTTVSFRGQRDRPRAAVAAREVRRRARRSTVSGRATRASCGARSRSAASTSRSDPTWAKLIDHAHSHFVEPQLIQPTILYDYPIELSPFARTTDDDETIVERFEYFAGGIELGNAFTEINDSEEQALRFAVQRDRARSRATSRPSRAIRTTSRRCRTACRRPAASASASTGSRCCFTGSESIRDVILFPALREKN